jgi:hypothetical protein
VHYSAASAHGAASAHSAASAAHEQERSVGIRQTINEKPAATAAVTAGIIVVAFAFIIWQACSTGGEGGVVSDKAFFTVDDGKTFFVDKTTNVPPFQTKDGKVAVRAQVFSCDDGKTKFVGYLEMYSQQDKMMLEAVAKGQTQGKGAQMPMPMPYMSGQPMVKKPGAPPNAWVGIGPQTSMFYQQVVSVKCPDGKSENLIRVFPE